MSGRLPKDASLIRQQIFSVPLLDLCQQKLLQQYPHAEFIIKAYFQDIVFERFSPRIGLVCHLLLTNRIENSTNAFWNILQRNVRLIAEGLNKNPQSYFQETFCNNQLPEISPKQKSQLMYLLYQLLIANGNTSFHILPNGITKVLNAHEVEYMLINGFRVEEFLVYSFSKFRINKLAKIALEKYKALFFKYGNNLTPFSFEGVEVSQILPKDGNYHNQQIQIDIVSLFQSYLPTNFENVLNQQVSQIELTSRFDSQLLYDDISENPGFSFNQMQIFEANDPSYSSSHNWSILNYDSFQQSEKNEEPKVDTSVVQVEGQSDNQEVVDCYLFSGQEEFPQQI